MFNRCGVTGDEYYKTDDNCTLVNEDGSLNYDDEFIRMPCEGQIEMEEME